MSEEIPVATHSGVLTIAGFPLRVHRLSDGSAVFDADDFNAFFAFLSGDEDIVITEEDTRRLAEFCKLGKMPEPPK